MIIIKNISKNILGEPLFGGGSLTILKGERIGIVGPNGSGKSTLLKIILGKIEPDAGSVNRERENIGYLPQEPAIRAGDTVASFLACDAARAESAMAKVGLADLSRNALARQLSGGQKTRLALAKILLQKPTMLLLDEPTNHLDLEGLAWLENFVRDFKGGVVIVSHDRRLLDNVVQRIVEIDPVTHAFVTYVGGYMDYVSEKEKRREIQAGDYRRQQNEKRRLELWLALKKQEARIHADPAKGRMIRAMEKRIQREIYDKTIPSPSSGRTLGALELNGEVTGAKLILRAQRLEKSFGFKKVVSGVDIEVRGPDHLLLVGTNGSGKTTLLKMLAGEMAPDHGVIRWGDNVRIGYFAQEHGSLHPEKTVMQEFVSTERLSPGMKNPRALLGSFLFGGQDVFKKVRDLSMGERVRLIFAKLTSQENELLILDEPTNHLDISSRETIEEALAAYRGAIIIVSHDRYFLDAIRVDRTLEMGNGVVNDRKM